jgi:ADP-ribosyl-[dinitrogen reductase] hydrolase
LYIALRYEGRLEEALIANAGVGGDSAARGFLIGALLGAADAVPARWAEALRERQRVDRLWASLDGENDL